MERVFNFENPFWCFMGKVFDLAILNVAWILCSLPIITAGASTTAMSSAVTKLADDKEGYVLQDFFRAFKSNFKQSTMVWMVSLAVGGWLVIDMMWYLNMKTEITRVLIIAVTILSMLYVMIMMYVFPILARCVVTFKKLIMLSFMMAIKNFGWTLLLLVTILCTVAIGVFVCGPVLFLAPGIIAYIHGKIFNIIFEQYSLTIA